MEMEINSGFSAVKFGATWCGPCKVLTPRFEKMKEEFENISFFSVNIDDATELAKEYKIRSVPTVILFIDGKEVNRITGAVMTDALRTAFRNLLKNAA